MHCVVKDCKYCTQDNYDDGAKDASHEFLYQEERYDDSDYGYDIIFQFYYLFFNG